jgi:hypothetical protein
MDCGTGSAHAVAREARVGVLMTHRHVAVSLILIILGVGCSRSRPPVNTTETGSWGKRLVVHEWPSGFYERGTVLEHDFRVINDTDLPIRFDRVQTSCTCTTAELAAKNLDPRGETVLKMALTVGRGRGIREASCVLLDDQGRSWGYRGRVTSHSPLEFATHGRRAYINLGVVDPGEEAASHLDVYTFAEPKRQPSHVEVLGDFQDSIQVHSEDCGVTTLPDGFRKRTTRLNIRLRGQSASGVRKCEVGIGCRVGEELIEGKASVTWEVRSRYRIEPKRVHLGAFRGDEPIKKSIGLKRFDSKAVMISAVRTRSPAIISEVNSTESSATVTLMVTPGLLSGPLYEEVRIELDDPVEPVIVVPLSLFR